MNICLDLSPTVHHHAGLGRYAHELLLALAKIDPENTYSIFYNNPCRARVDSTLRDFQHYTTFLSYRPWRLSVLLAHFIQFSQDYMFPGIDLFHATDYTLPYFSRLRSVFTLYDFSFQFYPETHTLLNRWFLTLMIPRFLRAADRLIAISECTKRDAIKIYGLNATKIKVIYGGVNPRFRPANPEVVRAVRAKYNLPDHFILYVGTVEPRKNLTTLLEAYIAVRERITQFPLSLVIVGKKGWLYTSFFHRLRELGLEKQVLLTGYVPDEDLPSIYSAADLFAFPSLYEGFGLPVLEAMACGTPVIASNRSSLPEVVGGAGILIDPLDVSGWVEAMERLLVDPEKRREMSEKGLQQAMKFSWEKAAAMTLEVYQSIFGDSKGEENATW